MNQTAHDVQLSAVQLEHGVLLCAVANGHLIVAEVAGSSAMLVDILLHAERSGCDSVLFHTSRKGLFMKLIDVANALPEWSAPSIVGYVVELKRGE